MEQRNARQILQTLAQGLDPFSGSVLPADALLQHPEVVRALMAGVAALEISAAREFRRAQLPGNVGRAWTDSEEQELVLAFRGGEQLEEIATRHGRSLTAIEARLERLGLLSAEQRVTRNRFRPGQKPQVAEVFSATGIPQELVTAEEPLAAEDEAIPYGDSPMFSGTRYDESQ